MRACLGRIFWLLLLLLSLLPVLQLPGTAYAAVMLEPVFSNLDFKNPVGLYQAPGDNTAWYVVEQPGRVMRVSEDRGQASASVFIDLRSQVDDGPNEAGLLGMAFAPDFARSGRVYLSYTRDASPLESVLSRFISRDGGKTLVPDSEQILLTVDQPYGNHNGGHILFGPDGYLYFGLGDGGSGGDPQGHGQNTRTLLGSLLRLDVSGDKAYAIPADNPFAQGGGRPEIYAYGLRNPWRWSFDRDTGELWLADVGQNQYEEINVIVRGGNYGWNLREGRHCYRGDCERPGLIDPLTEYSHSEGCSVTGGYVYRGRKIPELQGQYLFADFCSGRLWSFAASGKQKHQRLLDTSLDITSFAEDHQGEVYVLDRGGEIYRLISRP